MKTVIACVLIALQTWGICTLISKAGTPPKIVKPVSGHSLVASVLFGISYCAGVAYLAWG